MLKQNKLNLPTILTLCRIILVLPLMIFLSIDETTFKILAIFCFIIAAITDFIDGRIARKKHQVTNLGKFLDPLADKMLVNLTLLMFVVMNIIPVWIFAVILVRDFAVDGMRMMIAATGEIVAASFYGKAKTMIQMITITLIMVNLIFGNNIVYIISNILLYVMVFLTIFSGIDYLFKGWKKVIR